MNKELKVIQSNIAPLNTNHLWLNTDTNTIYKFDAKGWEAITDSIKDNYIILKYYGYDKTTQSTLYCDDSEYTKHNEEVYKKLLNINTDKPEKFYIIIKKGDTFYCCLLDFVKNENITGILKCDIFLELGVIKLDIINMNWETLHACFTTGRPVLWRSYDRRFYFVEKVDNKLASLESRISALEKK